MQRTQQGWPGIAASALAGLLALGSSCQSTEVALRVVIGGSPVPQQDFDRLLVTVAHVDAPELSTVEDIDAAAIAALPYSINYYPGPRTKAGDRITVTAVASAAATDVSTASSEVSLATGINELDLTLPAVVPAGCWPDPGCVTGLRCDGSCTAPKDLGASCSQASECASTQCSGGVCCDTACTGPCETCDLGSSRGHCGPRPAGSPGKAGCDPYLCAGDAGTCPTSCSQGSDCASPYSCSGAACVLATAPTNTKLPSTTGTARQGLTLTGDPGQWSGTQPISLALRWLFCNSAGGACTPTSTTASSYTLGPTDVGGTLRLQVNATNAGGSSSATSSASPVVQPEAPTNTAIPTISGIPLVGQTLSVAVGTWNGTPPISYSQQWRRCGSGGSGCSNIGGATGTSFTLTPAEAGGTVRVAVTATNAGGSSTATSAAAGPVETALLPAQSSWAYLDDGSDQGSLWFAAAFDDSTWARGPGVLGYGETFIDTTVSFGPNSSSKYVTTYFRTTFNVPDPAALSALTARVMYDDGFVLYVNGVEALRARMPAGAPAFTTLASSHEANQSYEAFDLSTQLPLLTTGSNTIAIEVHQSSVSSSDLVLDAILSAR